MAGYFVQHHPEALARLLHSPDGGVARELLRRGTRVQTRAKQLAPVDTGRLRSSIVVILGNERGELVCRIGTNVKYAPFQHEGTGLYGPYQRPIRPKSGKVLVFTPKGSSKPIFRPRVSGVKPHPFLKNALKAAFR